MMKAAYDIFIPGSVRHDGRLSVQEQILYGEIRGLCRQEGFCWASNRHFARRLETSVRTIQRAVHKLCDCGHLKVAFEDGHIRKIYLFEAVSPPMTPVSPPHI